MKTTKAKRKVAQRKPKQQAAAKPQRSFLAMFGFVLLGVVIGMITIQAVESKWLRSAVGSGVAPASGKDCASQITDVDQCSDCCESTLTMNGADSAEKKICAISCGTAFRSTDETTLANKAAAEKAQAEADASAGETIDAARADNPDYYAMQDASNAATIKNVEAAKAATTTSTAKTFSTEAECKASGCKVCQKKTATSSAVTGAAKAGAAAKAAGGTDADGQAGYEAAQNCMSHADNDIEGCKSCCADQDLNTFALSSCRENCVAPDATDSASEAQVTTAAGANAVAKECSQNSGDSLDNCKLCCDYAPSLSGAYINVCRKQCEIITPDVSSQQSIPSAGQGENNAYCTEDYQCAGGECYDNQCQDPDAG